MRTASALAAVLLAISIPAFSQEKVVTPDLSKVDGWKLSDTSAEAVEVDGRKAVRLKAKGDSAQGLIGIALAPGVEFTTGTIEVELKGKNVRQESFLGVAFNVAGEKKFEAVYFRPFNFKAEGVFKGRAIQYVSWPEHIWEKLRETKPGVFEAPINPVPDPDGWFRARIEVGEKQVRVYVNDATEPSLTVDRLAEGGKPRPAGLMVDVSDGLYANLQFKPVS